MKPETIGLIGVGLLGSALRERFLAGGFEVAGFDIDARRSSVPSAAHAAEGRERVVLSLPNSGVVSAVLDEIAPHLQPGAIVIDTTTGDPDEVSGFGPRLAARGIHYLDATVGGSSKQARAGQAIVLCGGEPEIFAAATDLFCCFARETFHVGPCGSGARMKLVLNLVLGLNRAVLAEGLTFAAACGLQPERALQVLRAGPAYSLVMDTKGHKMISGDFTPEARLSQHLKDVCLILAAGERHQAWLPLSELHRELLEKAEQQGLGDADNSAVMQVFKRVP